MLEEVLQLMADNPGLRVLPLSRPVFDEDGELISCTCGQPHLDGVCLTCSQTRGEGVDFTPSCRDLGHRPCLPESTIGKHPLTRHVPHGEVEGSDDPGTVRRWWADGPHNVGLIVGRAGMVIADVDGEEGEEEWKSVTASDPELAVDTFTVTTGSGRHLYFSVPAGHPLRDHLTSGSKVKVKGKWPGCKHVDIRADGYVVGPGSVHRTGRVYEGNGRPVQPLSVRQCDRIWEWVSQRLDQEQKVSLWFGTDLTLPDHPPSLPHLAEEWGLPGWAKRELEELVSQPVVRGGRSELHMKLLTRAARIGFRLSWPPERVGRFVFLAGCAHPALLERWFEKRHVIRNEVTIAVQRSSRREVDGEKRDVHPFIRRLLDETTRMGRKMRTVHEDGAVWIGPDRAVLLPELEQVEAVWEGCSPPPILPEPFTGGVWEEKEEEVVAWLVSCLRPDVTPPVLHLVGEKASSWASTLVEAVGGTRLSPLAAVDEVRGAVSGRAVVHVDGLPVDVAPRERPVRDLVELVESTHRVRNFSSLVRHRPGLLLTRTEERAMPGCPTWEWRPNSDPPSPGVLLSVVLSRLVSLAASPEGVVG